MALGHSRHLGSWALGRSGTWALEGHMGIQALGHLGTWALKALEALYLFKFLYYFDESIILSLFVLTTSGFSPSEFFLNFR